MNDLRLIIFSILLLLAVSGNAGRQQALPDDFSVDYNVSHITIDDGLPHNFIDDIFMDSRGFVWISLGGGGLVRYDGHDFLKFGSGSVSTDISDDFVHCVAEDPYLRLWVATANGLDIISLATLSSIQPETLSASLAPLTLGRINSVTADSKGRIWIVTPGEVRCVEFDTSGSVIRICSLALPPDSDSNSLMVSDIDYDGQVWMEIGGALCKLTPGAEGRMVRRQLNITLPQETLVNAMVVKDEDVWIATNKGLLRHNPGAGLNKWYNHSDTDHRSLSQDFVTTLGVTDDNRLIAGTLCGINIFRPISDNFIHTTSQSDSGLSSNFVNCVFVHGANIWLGTETGGVNLFMPKQLATTFYRHEPANARSLSRNPVNAILEEPDGTLWVGTVEGGLNRKDAADTGFTHYTTNNSRLCHNSVSVLEMDGDHRLWVGTWGGGVDVIDPAGIDRQASGITRHLSDFGSFGPRPYIGALKWDPYNGGMWIGTSRGIFFCDSATGEITEPFDGASTGLLGCIGAAIDDDGHLWMGGSNGVCVIDLKSRSGNHWSYRFLHNKLDDTESGKREKVSSVFKSSDGTIWIGSDIHGLYRRTVDASGIETFVNLTTDDGLVQNAVMGIAEDAAHRMWIATNNGLSCLYPAEGRFLNYTRHHGLPSQGFYWNAYCSSRRGKILLGTLDGLLEIDPSLISEDNEQHRVVFTRLYIDNEPVMPDAPEGSPDISVTDHLRLHERNKSFSIEFSALDYNRNPASNYFYRLEGFDTDWIKLPQGRHFVTYTNLPPGDYVLKVAYSADDMTEPENVSELKISVGRYFFHTLWFYLIVVAVLVLIVLWIVKRRIRGIDEQKRRLQEAVEERTREISQQKQVLEERAMRIQELTVDRLSFFTNLTHEFRTPVTLIMGPVRRAMQLNTNPQVNEQLCYAERNAHYLLTLVNQLMDFRKIESGKMEIVRRRANFPAMVREVVESFSPSARSRNISLTYNVHMSTPDVCFDKEAMRKLLNNFLSNACKYTPDGGSINVNVALLPQTCTGGEFAKLYISVSDTGDGIDPTDIDKVFDRFYQGKSTMKYPNVTASSGIGLFLCKSIVEAYGGEVTVRNNPVHGCTFRVLLPVPNTEDMEASPALSMQAIASAESLTEESSERVTILVVEDNADMRGFIRSLLLPKYDVMEATDGEEALRKLAMTDADLIVCDLMMPGMDGMELTRKVRENFATSHIPILMLTARTSDETRLDSYRMGVDDYILKPFSEEMLLTRIDNILRSKQRLQRKFTLDFDTGNISQPEESPDKKFMDQIMDVVKDNYKNSYFEVGDFAEALGVSRSFLNKKLQSLVGMSASQFMRNYRLNLAREMIIRNRETRAMNISEIAYDVGFNDSKYFTRCFTKHFNITPSNLLSENYPPPLINH